MNKYFFLIFFFFFVLTHARTPACVNIIDSLFSNVKSLKGFYVKDIKINENKISTKVYFYEDLLKGRKKYIVKKGEEKTTVYIMNDSIFVNIDDIVYYDRLIKDSLNLLSSSFGFGLFDILKSLKFFADISDISTKRVDGNDYLRFQILKNIPTISNIIIKLDKENGLPEIVEIYDANNKVILQVFLKSYSDNFPKSIRSFVDVGGNVVEEIVTIKVLEKDKSLEDDIFNLGRNKNKFEKLEKIMNDAGIAQW